MLFISRDRRILPTDALAAACVNQTKMIISAIFTHIDPERANQISTSNKSLSGMLFISRDRRNFPIWPIAEQEGLGGAVKIKC